MAPLSGRKRRDRTVITGDTDRAVMAEYQPPYDLTSDILVAFSLLPTAPLRHAFPGTPFLSLLGRTPGIIWFSQVTDGWYCDANGFRRRLGERGAPLYAELDILAALWRLSAFVPGIYATSSLSIHIGRRFGMPKRSITMYFNVENRTVVSESSDAARMSMVRARITKAGRLLAAAVSNMLPRWSLPVRFPSGATIRALIPRVLGIHPARITEGYVAVAERWLPQPVALFPFGLYLRGLSMRLPAPLNGTQRDKACHLSPAKGRGPSVR